MADNKAYKLLLSDEDRIILKTREIREKMVDSYIDENGIPTQGKDMRVMNEILTSLDSQVISMVDLRLKNDANENDAEVKSMVSEIIRKVNKTKDENKRADNNVKIDDKYIPDDVVPGEDQIEYEELSLEHFAPTIKKDN